MVLVHSPSCELDGTLRPVAFPGHVSTILRHPAAVFLMLCYFYDVFSSSVISYSDVIFKIAIEF